MAERDCARYGPDGKRYCPRCGARVAQQADTCLVCHARLDECPSPRHLPLAEGIVLLFVILLAWGWWEGRAARTVLYARRFTVTARQRALVSPSATPTRTPTATRTPTWTPTATPTATPTPQVYKVQPHDTLAGIAAEHGITVQRLARANGLDLGSLLQVGQELVIPGPEGTPYPTPTPTPRAAIVNYVTQKGDTLTLIAERFHVPLEVILKNNRVPNPALLKPGTVLVIPIGTPEPTPTPTPILTPTPTPGPRYPAPVPVLPREGALFQGPDAHIRLAWTAVGFLRPGERYRVFLKAGRARWTFDTDSTSLTIPSRLYPQIRSRGSTVSWRVQVVVVADGEWAARSPLSPPRTLTWR